MSTGNAERDDHIVAAVNALNASGAIITTASLSALLPADFELDDSEWREFCDTTVPTAPTREAATADVTEPPTAPVAAAVEPVEKPLTFAEAEVLRARVIELETMAADQRASVAALEFKVRSARARKAQALSAYLRGTPSLTPEQNVRVYLAQSLRERAAAVAEGGAPGVPAHGDSVIDANAAYATSGGADAFVRKQMTFGHRRGGLPQNQRGRRFLPSERG